MPHNWTTSNTFLIDNTFFSFFFKSKLLHNLLIFKADQEPTHPFYSRTEWSGWHPPNNPNYNVNFDGAIFSYINVSGIGVVILDYNGSVISALSPWISLTFSVEEVEAWASPRVVLFVKEISIFEAILIWGWC